MCTTLICIIHHTCARTHTHNTHTDCSRNWVLILVGAKILWEEEGFQFGFKRWHYTSEVKQPCIRNLLTQQDNTSEVKQPCIRNLLTQQDNTSEVKQPCIRNLLTQQDNTSEVKQPCIRNLLTQQDNTSEVKQPCIHNLLTQQDNTSEVKQPCIRNLLTQQDNASEVKQPCIRNLLTQQDNTSEIKLPWFLAASKKGVANDDMSVQTLRLDLRECPACSRTANEVVLDRARRSRHTPSQRSEWVPRQDGNCRKITVIKIINHSYKALSSNQN